MPIFLYTTVILRTGNSVAGGLCPVSAIGRGRTAGGNKNGGYDLDEEARAWTLIRSRAK